MGQKALIRLICIVTWTEGYIKLRGEPAMMKATWFASRYEKSEDRTMRVRSIVPTELR